MSHTHRSTDGSHIACRMSDGGAVTATLRSLSQTPFDWCSKKQATVETATHGAECPAARTCVERVRAHRLALMCLGVPTLGSSHMSGDNKSVIDSSAGLRLRLHKRHNALSCHHVREATAAKVIQSHHIAGGMSPADILSRHWGHRQVWPVLGPAPPWQGGKMTTHHDQSPPGRQGSDRQCAPPTD